MMLLFCVLLFTGALGNEIPGANDNNIQAAESQAAPFWVARPQSTTVAEGQDAMFDCVLSSLNGRTVIWLGPRGTLLALNDTPHDPHYRINGNFNLVIKHALPSDEGQYQCVVSEFDTAHAMLNVNGLKRTTAVMTTHFIDENTTPNAVMTTHFIDENTTPNALETTQPRKSTTTHFIDENTTPNGCLKYFDQNFGDIYNPGYPSGSNNGNCDYEIYVNDPNTKTILLRFAIFDFDDSRCLSDYLSFEDFSYGRSLVCRNGTDIVIGRDYYFHPTSTRNFIHLYTSPGYDSKFKAYFEIINGFRRTACTDKMCSNHCPMGHVVDIGQCRNTCDCKPEFPADVKTTPEHQAVISKSLLLTLIKNVVNEGSNLESLLRDVERQIQFIKSLVNNNTIVG